MQLCRLYARLLSELGRVVIVVAIIGAIVSRHLLGIQGITDKINWLHDKTLARWKPLRATVQVVHTSLLSELGCVVVVAIIGAIVSRDLLRDGRTNTQKMADDTT